MSTAPGRGGLAERVSHAAAVGVGPIDRANASVGPVQVADCQPSTAADVRFDTQGLNGGAGQDDTLTASTERHQYRGPR